MKSIINKFISGAGLLAISGLVCCTADLEQLPRDPDILTPDQFIANPEEYIAGLIANCYAGMTISGQEGAGSSNITGPDAGMSCYSRAIYMLNEFPTDETAWIYFSDAGVEELVTATWGTDNPVINLVYSRLYTHIAVCNDFLRNMRNITRWNIYPDEKLQSEIDQFCLEARALRAYSYFYVIDFFGRAAVAWDIDDNGKDIPYGTIPPQAESRAALYDKVVADLEDVRDRWPRNQEVVYGRIGLDAVEGLLSRFYLNEKVFTDGASDAGWDKCRRVCNEIISRHDVNAAHGLARDYLALFGASNDRFMPGHATQADNEILWGLPYDHMNTQSYGGSDFLLFASIVDAADNDMTDGFCNKTWYGVQSAWGCMHVREQLADLFDFSRDGRTYLWLREEAGFARDNDVITKLTDGYLPIKFTNIPTGPEGTYYRFADANGLPRIAGDSEMMINPSHSFVDTDLPLIRLAEIYLNAAECALHGAGSEAQGLRYLRYVRERAGLTTPVAELTPELIIDERGRELYWENLRRTDLIRFGLFTGDSYNWNWKSGAPEGASIAPHMAIYPIPAAVIASYGRSHYRQNPDY